MVEFAGGSLGTWKAVDRPAARCYRPAFGRPAFPRDRTPHGVSRMVMGIVASIVALAAICSSPSPLQAAEPAPHAARGTTPAERVVIVPLRLDPSGVSLGTAVV